MSLVTTAAAVTPKRRPKYWSRLFRRQVWLPLLFIAVVLAAWQSLLGVMHVSELVLVPPSEILAVLRDNWAILLQQASITGGQAVEGYIAGSLLGIAIGALLTFSVRVRQALYPHLVLFQLIPKIALAPLFIIWLGVGNPSRLAFMVFMSFFPIAVATAAGLSATPPVALRLARSLLTSKWDTFVLVRFPYAIPFICTGLKVGATMAMIGLIVGEFVTAQAGLGYVIMFASSAGQTALLFAALFLLCGLGLLLYGAATGLELVLKRWYGAPFSSDPLT